MNTMGEIIYDREGNEYMWSYLENCLVKSSCKNNNQQVQETIDDKILLLTEECNYET